ncbi:MAG TPA: HAD family hydrolase [Frankiaceae bacterium]|jgi:putative hydrolase of the HAD superfamily|nr:HAD family hydrolase [Frankiaceae bacterium]
MRYGEARPLVVIDGDDTLWLTEHLYDDARQACANAIAGAGLDAVEWERRQRRLDLERADVLGLSASRFPGSCALAAHAIAADVVPATRSALVREVRERAAAVFATSITARPEARPLLRHMRRAGARIVLCTQGDPVIQQARVAQSGLGHWFDNVVIVPFKKRSTFATIRASYKTAHALAVGNSLRSDIAPALAAGYECIHLDAHAWERERLVGVLAGAPHRVHNLQEVREVFDSWILSGAGVPCP